MAQPCRVKEFRFALPGPIKQTDADKYRQRSTLLHLMSGGGSSSRKKGTIKVGSITPTVVAAPPWSDAGSPTKVVELDKTSDRDPKSSTLPFGGSRDPGRGEGNKARVISRNRSAGPMLQLHPKRNNPVGLQTAIDDLANQVFRGPTFKRSTRPQSAPTLRANSPPPSTATPTIVASSTAHSVGTSQMSINNNLAGVPAPEALPKSNHQNSSSGAGGGSSSDFIIQDDDDDDDGDDVSGDNNNDSAGDSMGARSKSSASGARRPMSATERLNSAKKPTGPFDPRDSIFSSALKAARCDAIGQDQLQQQQQPPGTATAPMNSGPSNYQAGAPIWNASRGKIRPASAGTLRKNVTIGSTTTGAGSAGTMSTPPPTQPQPKPQTLVGQGIEGLLTTYPRGQGATPPQALQALQRVLQQDVARQAVSHPQLPRATTATSAPAQGVHHQEDQQNAHDISGASTIPPADGTTPASKNDKSTGRKRPQSAKMCRELAAERQRELTQERKEHQAERQEKFDASHTQPEVKDAMEWAAKGLHHQAPQYGMRPQSAGSRGRAERMNSPATGGVGLGIRIGSEASLPSSAADTPTNSNISIGNDDERGISPVSDAGAATEDDEEKKKQKSGEVLSTLDTRPPSRTSMVRPQSAKITRPTSALTLGGVNTSSSGTTTRRPLSAGKIRPSTTTGSPSNPSYPAYVNNLKVESQCAPGPQRFHSNPPELRAGGGFYMTASKTKLRSRVP